MPDFERLPQNERIAEDTSLEQLIEKYNLRSFADIQNFAIDLDRLCGRGTGVKFMDKIMSDPDFKDQRVLDEIVEFAAKEGAEDMAYGYESIAANPNLTTEQIIKLASVRYEAVLRNLAMNVKTPHEVLEKLAESDYPLVLEAVARHPNSPKESS